ncbi:hypothetical protein JCM8097_003579 [Rhodosporidiobolus ruineniae]
MAGLTIEQLRQQLSSLGLDSRGHKDVLKKRLLRARSRLSSASPTPPPPLAPSPRPATERTRPPGETYDSFLVFDVEATCQQIEGPYGRLAFAYPNEIIEWPVILLQWRRRPPPAESAAGPSEEEEEDDDAGEFELVQVDEYHSFVKPTWQPTLSEFCTQLTGIEQSDIDAAPSFEVLCRRFYRDFILKHRLFTPENKTIWVTDGPWDLRDFVAKTCYLSRHPRPSWLAGEIIDLRILVSNFFATLKEEKKARRRNGGSPPPSPSPSPAPRETAPAASPPVPSPPAPEAAELPRPTPLAAPADLPSTSSSALPLSSDSPSDPSIPTYLPSHLLSAPASLSLPFVLSALTLPPFSGRLHSGLSDARNASRILIDLSRRGVRLEGNRTVPEGAGKEGRGGKERRWGWMTRTGEVKWEEFRRWEEGREGKKERKAGKGYVSKVEEG